MNEKGKVVSELTDEKWLWNLTFLCSASYYLNGLNNRLHCQQFRFDMLGAVRAFEMIRLPEVFQKQLANVNLCHFTFSDLLH
jgi:hypothetical protein